MCFVQLLQVTFGYQAGGQVFKSVDIAADFDSRIALASVNLLGLVGWSEQLSAVQLQSCRNGPTNFFDAQRVENKHTISTHIQLVSSPLQLGKPIILLLHQSA
jgi:hypothetical protein